jgi:sugar O-acyltransferase (sialic acid O-acetyltransferase NeuD family)
MSKPGLILVGAGGHAHACIEVIEQHGEFLIAGLVGTPEELHTRHLGYAVVATDRDMQELAKVHQFALIVVGQIKSVANRMRLYREAAACGFRLPAIVAPTAHVSRHAMLGAGSIVMHGAIVNAGAIVGENCIVNSRALVEHDARVEDHCHISTGAILNGNAHLGAGSFVGSGSIIKEGVKLGKACVIGMGLAVRHDLPDGAIFLGGANS